MVNERRHAATDPLSVKSCPLVEWYSFKRCRVTSCKNYSSKTPCRCMAIDRVKPEGTKPISDSELNYYKFEKSNTSTRVVQIKRKKAIRRVKSVIALRHYVQYISDRFTEGGVFDTRTIKLVESSYPLNSPDIAWKNWMWEFFLDTEVWEDFVGRSGREGELGDIHLHNMLHIKLSRFERLIREFNKPQLSKKEK